MKIDYTHIVSHQSSREGARIHLLVLHTTEGSGSLETLGSIFDNDNEEASSHFGIDAKGRIARYVADSAKAWTQCNYNPVCLSAEQIGYAEFSRSEWFKRHAQLHGAAEFLVYGHVHYGVPIRRGQVSGGGIIRDGVVQHKDLGAIGCGHSDCGEGYPQDYVMLLARYFVAHKLHPTAPHTERLRKEVNNVRHHHGVDPIPTPK
jgi:hypothetical protein